MEDNPQVITPHGRFLDILFAYLGAVSHVFQDVKGLYGISHIAITHIENHRIMTFSSTPSLEFNLFSSNLWRFDKTYQTSWYQRCAMSAWPSLYTKAHYDELYYLKQLKHHLPLGVTFSTRSATGHVIYSMASHNADQETQDAFKNQQEHFCKIGQYCASLLLPFFQEALSSGASANISAK
ncbi:MAG: hypothetical protein NTW94_10175 [Legionellales bacterium]|nr:hypothetical protein [Legionellales bacterium]